jgi:hypothetical protein
VPKQEVEHDCHLDIFEDLLSMKLFTGNILQLYEHPIVDVKRTKRRVMQYQWQEDVLYFQNLVVPRPKDRLYIIRKMHNEIGHFGETCTLFEIKQCFF